jgi:hypothetical protein
MTQAQTAAKTTKKKSSTTTTQVTPNIVWKGDEEFRHDLYKLHIDKMKRNVSYKEAEPSIQEIEHVHFFHSHDKKGKVNETCQPVGGHFHKILTSVDAKGNLVAECGPPLRMVSKKMRNGKQKKIVESVYYITEDPGTNITDTHKHKMEYLRSELISPNRVLAGQRRDAERLKQMQGSVGFTPQTTVEQKTDSDAPTIKEM